MSPLLPWSHSPSLPYLVSIIVITSYFIVACFHVWQDEKKNVIDLKKNVAELQNKLEEERFNNLPKFAAGIGAVITQYNPPIPKMQIMVMLRIVNKGADSMVGVFEAKINSLRGEELSIVPFLWQGEYKFYYSENESVTYKDEHLLQNKCLDGAVKRGCILEGVLPCKIDGLANDVDLDFSSLKVTFLDMNNTLWETDPFSLHRTTDKLGIQETRLR